MCCLVRACNDAICAVHVQLKELGLTYITAFGCSMNFLFQPLSPVSQRIDLEMRRMREPNTFTIGIQIRMGDHVLSGGDSPIDLSQPKLAQFFSCAQQIEESLPRLLKNHKVIWLLVSDSTKVREAAIAEYGEKVMTKLDLKLGHSFLRSDDEKEPGQRFSNSNREAFLAAAAEHYLLGMADAHVISWDSSFGRTAAFRAMNPEGWLFELSSKHPLAECRLGMHHTPFQESSRHYAGVKHLKMI